MDHPPYVEEDEIDLRQYVAVLLKYWVWIVGAAIIAGGAALLVTSMQPKNYEARADVLILETKTELTLDPKYQTIVDDLDAKSSQQTLVSLVKSSDVAVEVLARSDDLLAPEEKSVRSLLERISTANTGNIITIIMTASSPEQAAGLANLWAATYIEYVSHLYNTPIGSLLGEVKLQAEEVQQRYLAVQGDLEKMLADNRIEMLSREILTKKQQAQSLRDRAAVIETTPLYLFELWQDNQRQILANKYSELQSIESWLAAAAALQAQLEAAPTRPENQLALLLLRSRMAGNAGIQLQLNPADLAGQAVTPADITQLSDGLTQRQSQLLAEIEQLAAALPAQQAAVPAALPVSAELTGLMAQLDAEIQQLESELEAQTARKRELTQARDLAWENLNTVQRKAAEVELSSQMTNTQVRSAGAALPPDSPTESRRLVNAAIAGALGLMLAVFVAFAWEWWRNE